jgi:membrane protein YqaA with SNARE-associated domain
VGESIVVEASFLGVLQELQLAAMVSRDVEFLYANHIEILKTIGNVLGSLVDRYVIYDDL